MGHSLSTVFFIDYLQKSKKSDRRVYYTPQEIAKHYTEDSMWIVAGNKVYDITNFYKQKNHPGGTLALETRAGGTLDCAPDLKFHSKNTRKFWNNYLIAYVAK